MRDLAGLYLTDNYVDVLIGAETSVNRRRNSMEGLVLDFDYDTEHHQVTLKGHTRTHAIAAITEACNWIAERCPDLRSVGIGSAGPFKNISKDIRDREIELRNDGVPLDLYGTLGHASHGPLSELQLTKLVRDTLESRQVRPKVITVETDVTVAAMGEVYERHRTDHEADKKAIVFMKISHGVGGAFFRLVTPWQGRLHTEAGQFNVPRWRGHHAKGSASIYEQIGAEAGWRWITEEQTWTHKKALNPDSVEGLASIHAINSRFAGLSDTPNGFYISPYESLTAQPDHFVWDREAWYIAQMAWALTCAASPYSIVLGGSVMMVPGLLEKVQDHFAYITGPDPFPAYDEMQDPASFLVRSTGSDGKTIGRPGIRGALCMAAMEHSRA